jgi:hypothetical protein
VAPGGRWYPCCCPIEGYGSSLGVSSGLVLSGSDVFGERGSSQIVACGCCAGGVAPFQVQVEVSGVHTHVPGLCDACDDYNATYILTWTTEVSEIIAFCFPPGSSCGWSLEFPTTCGRSRAHVVIGCGPTVVDVQFAIMPTDCGSGEQWLRWRQAFDISPLSFDCLFDGLELPYVTPTTEDCTTSEPVRLYAV